MLKCIKKGCANPAVEGSNYCEAHQPDLYGRRKVARKKVAKKKAAKRKAAKKKV